MPRDSTSSGSTQEKASLASHDRGDEFKPPPSVTLEHAALSGEGAWDNIENTLRNAYPLVLSDLSEAEWTRLVSAFRHSYPARPAELWKMPYELYGFVKRENYAAILERPYLTDLVFFEWIEIFVRMTAGASIPEQYTVAGDALDDKIVVNPDHVRVEFTYPVFRLAPDVLRQDKPEAGKYFVTAYWHPQLLKVCFVELSEFYYCVLEVASTKLLTGAELREEAAKMITKGSAPSVNEVREFVEAAIEQGIVLGYADEGDAQAEETAKSA